MPQLRVIGGAASAAGGELHVRVQMLGMLHQQPINVDLPGLLLRLDGSGFSFRSPFEIPEQAVHRFRLQHPKAEPVVAQARCVRTVSTKIDSDLRFIHDFVWTLEEPAPNRQALLQLLGTANETPLGETPGLAVEFWPRLLLYADASMETLLIAAPVELRGFELGGCVVDTPAPIDVGTEAFLRFEATDSLVMTLRVRVIHARPERRADLPPRFVSGLQFIDSNGTPALVVAELFRRIADPGGSETRVDAGGRPEASSAD